MHAPDILLITAHPQMEHSRINRRLMRAARKLPADAKVLVRDLYSIYPDYLIDVAAEQAALAAAQLVVWQHPIHWYHMPPLMKLWVDEVLAFGWAYGAEGSALQGKDLWLVASTGGPQESYRPDSYNRYFFDAFLPPYEQTAALCGMRFLPPMLFHGAHRVGRHEVLRCKSPAVPNAIAAFLLHVQKLTGKLPHVYFGWTEGNPLAYVVRFIALGEGDTAPVTREVLRQRVEIPANRPRVHVG